MAKLNEPIICDQHQLIDTEKLMFWMNHHFTFFFSCENCVNCGKCKLQNNSLKCKQLKI